MAVKFNPFTGQLQIDEKGSGGGSSYIDGEVQNFSALPETLGSPAVDSAYLCREPEGTWLLNRKPAGIYIRTANTGTRANDWTYAGEFPDVFNDANFVLYDNGDSTKNLQFQLSGISTGTTRTLTAPDASGTIARTEDFAAPPAIGNTTPNTGAFTTLTAQGDGTNALVAQFGAADGINNQIQIWGNGANRNNVLEASVAGLSLRVGAGGNHCQLAVNAIPNGFRTSANAAFHWSNHASNANTGTTDLILARDDAGVMAQRNSTNPQTFRLYNTFTDASNYERGFMRWSSNVLQIGTEAAGTGTLRGLNIGTATSSLLGFYGVTPVDQPATVADPAGGGTIDTEARTAIGEVIDRLQELGLIA